MKKIQRSSGSHNHGTPSTGAGAGTDIGRLGAWSPDGN